MVWWWRRSRREGDGAGEWQDIADSWDDPGRRPRARSRGQSEWDDEDWDDEEWEERDEDEGWQDPDPGPRRESFLSWLLLLPVRIILFPFRFVFWFAALCLLWIVAYAWFDPPFWDHLSDEQSRLGSVVATSRDLDAISPNLIRAVMAAEDADFCDHWGLDFDAIRAALRERRESGRLLGASTITQQTAKNVFLWHDRSWLRKGLEAAFALGLETIWGKRRIMEVYLNVAEFDTGTFGAEAAARKYFGKRAADLTLGEAARLAAVLPDPKDRNAANPGPGLRQRAAAIADGARTLERTGRDACVLD